MRPAELLSPLNTHAFWVQGDAARLDLLNRHSRVFWFLSVLVYELDEVNKISVKEVHTLAPRINELLPTKVEAVPAKQIGKRGDLETLRSAGK